MPSKVTTRVYMIDQTDYEVGTFVTSEAAHAVAFDIMERGYRVKTETEVTFYPKTSVMKVAIYEERRPDPERPKERKVSPAKPVKARRPRSNKRAVQG